MRNVNGQLGIGTAYVARIKLNEHASKWLTRNVGYATTSPEKEERIA
jgi:hypothetical protein